MPDKRKPSFFVSSVLIAYLHSQELRGSCNLTYNNCQHLCLNFTSVLWYKTSSTVEQQVRRGIMSIMRGPLLLSCLALSTKASPESQPLGKSSHQILPCFQKQNHDFDLQTAPHQAGCQLNAFASGLTKTEAKQKRFDILHRYLTGFFTRRYPSGLPRRSATSSVANSCSWHTPGRLW